MSMIKRTTAILAACTVLACACEKEIKFIGEYEGEKIVLYATANPGQPLSVILNKSDFILSSEDYYGDDGLPGASVKAVCNGKEITFSDRGSGFYESDYIPAVGDMITLTASHAGYGDVTATTRVPAAPVFTITDLRHESSTSEYYFTDKLTFQIRIDDPAGTVDYYRIKLFESGGMQTDNPYVLASYPLQLFTRDLWFYERKTGIDLVEDIVEPDRDILIPDIMEDGVINGESYTFTAWYTRNQYREKYYNNGGEWESSMMDTNDFSLDNYVFEIDAVSEELFQYAKSIDLYYSSTSGLNSFFGEGVSISNNVIGGIGCFGAITSKIIPLSEFEQTSF